MRKIRHRSPIPLYVMAGVCLTYCLIFNLYKLSHFLILGGLCAGAYYIASRIWPGTVEEIKEPVTTGDEKIDALLRQGDASLEELERLCAAIKDSDISTKARQILELTEVIFKDLVEDPADYNIIKRFSSYFMPETEKLLSRYEDIERKGISGENAAVLKERISRVLDKSVQAYRKTADSLFANQALDIDTDITVLETMLKKAGLSGTDFKL